MNAKQKAQQEAIESLRDLIKPGDTVYTILKHVSKSGMYRVIDVKVIKDNEPLHISYNVARAIGARFDERHNGVGVGGCGFDVGFDVVYNLAYYLFKDGFDCIGEKCTSNEHSNGDRDYSPHRHSSGGYALRHRWM